MEIYNHITQSDAQWILDVWLPERNHSYLSPERLHKHAKFQSILRNKPIEVPSCKCEHQTFTRISNSLFEQFEQIIRERAQNQQ